MNLNLDKKLHYLLACSFGPDSMSLFDMLLKEKYIFSAALVNYHFRKESDEEEKDFISFCKINNICYYVKSVDGLSLKGNLEENARKIRYKFFTELCLQHNFDAVLVAHHQDDLIETYLMQKERKNLVLHYGLKEDSILFNSRVIRPLLNYKKTDLIEYCKENDVPYMIDKSNYSYKYKRNFYRHEVVEKLNDDQRKEILNEIKKENQEIDKIFAKINNLDLNKIDVYFSLNDKERNYAINEFLQRKCVNKSLSKKFVKEIFEAFSSKKPIIKIKLNNSYFLVKDYGQLRLDDGMKNNYEYKLEKPCILDTPYFYLDFTKDSSNRNVSFNDYPIIIRNAKKRDLIKIKDYYVMARRLFIDWKMPSFLREYWPVILDKNFEVIYIPRYQKDFKATKECNFYIKIKK